MNPQHYYGSIVRKLFILAAVLTFLIYPFFYSFLPQQPTLMIFAVAVLAVMAGLTSRQGRLAITVDMVISFLAILFFENHAIIFLKVLPRGIFLADQILTFIFFFALYYSVKTFRGMSSDKPESL